jgi:hypothetical protein
LTALVPLDVQPEAMQCTI